MNARAGAAFLALALLSGCAFSMVRDGQLREEPFAELVTRTAAARGDPRPAHVDARVVAQDEVAPLLRESIVHAWPPVEIARYQERLVAIGLWPPDRDLVEETLAVAREEVAGFYLPEAHVLYAVEGVHVPFSLRVLSMLTRRDLLRETVFAHELVHLLQHRSRPALFEVSAWTEQDDAAAAVEAALEGDATHYGFLALGLEPDPAAMQASMDADLAERREGALARAPGLVRLTLAFPYVRGYPLSLREGTALLDAPPASTEQAIHPERRHASFLVMDLAGLESSFPVGCTSLGQNTLGELGIWVLLSDLGAPDAAASASGGWDGDRYLAARCGGAHAFAWRTSWDSEQDAREFANAISRVAGPLAERAGLVGPPEVEVAGAVVWVHSAPLSAPADGASPRAARIASLDELRDFFGLEATQPLR